MFDSGGKSTTYSLGECEFKDSMTSADWEQLTSDCTVWLANMRPDATFADALVRVTYSAVEEGEDDG